MNVLESIKGKITNVQQDITSSLASVRNPVSVQKSSLTVNANAGSEILTRFQDNWVEIHHNTEENANAAKEVDQMASGILQFCETQNEAVEQMHNLACDLPQLNTTMTELMDRIGDLSSLLSTVSHELVVLEDLCEETVQHANKQHHYKQLHVYTNRRQSEIAQCKVQMARVHASKVKDYETSLQSQIRDRQEAFEPAYTQELQHYKQYGTTTVKPTAAIVTDVGDIKVEENTNELQEFLNVLPDTVDEDNNDKVLESPEVEPSVSAPAPDDDDT